MTPLEILEAFPDEIKTIVPREIKRLKKELSHVTEFIERINQSDIPQEHKNFYCQAYVIIYADNEIKSLARLEKLQQLSRKPAQAQTLDLQRAKLYPIADIYSFDKIIRMGKRQKCSCPFHADKTPSFVIYENNTFHCFSCKAGGDAINFYQLIHKCDFKTAVNALS